MLVKGVPDRVDTGNVWAKLVNIGVQQNPTKCMFFAKYGLLVNTHLAYSRYPVAWKRISSILPPKMLLTIDGT